MATRAGFCFGGMLGLTLAAMVAANACNASGDAAPGGSGGAGSTGAQTSGTAASGASSTGALSGGGSEDFDGGNAAATGTGGLDPDAACASASSEAESGLTPADIIIAVDTSGSMDEESAQVQANLNNFAQIIAASGIDVHVILIADASVCIPAPLGTGSCPGDESLPGYQHVPQGVSSNDALSLILSTYPQWKGSLRAGATKTLAVVSDDDSDLDAASFTAQLLALDPPTFEGFQFDAIVAFDDPAVCSACFFNCAACQSKCCNTNLFCTPISAAEGTVYKQLVDQTGGVIGDLCAQDFDPVFQDMATAVVQGSTVACVYDIPPIPDGGMIDPTKVNVSYTGSSGMPQTIGYVPGGAADCGAAGGWYYDDPASPTQIFLCDLTCTAVQGDPNGKIEVLFGCDTVIADPT
jgi:hypothetical protein